MPRDETSELILEVARLGKVYGKHRVLDGVSFSLHRGETALITGANGAGKSTLLRCLAGLARFEGNVTIAGVPLRWGHRNSSRVGYVPQSVELPGSATVGEVINLFAGLRSADPGALDVPSGFIPEWDRRVGTLSGGQRQRVILAATLQGRTPLLLLDEPAANLDEEGEHQLGRFLRNRAAAGAAVLLASPSPVGVVGRPDRIIQLGHRPTSAGEETAVGLSVVKGTGGWGP